MFVFYFILKVNQYWPNSLNHLFSTENEVSVQMHEGPRKTEVEMGVVPVCLRPIFSYETFVLFWRFFKLPHLLLLPLFDKIGLAL